MSYQRFSKQSSVALALAMVACGGAPLNQAKLAEAQTALHAAETSGAENDPKAKQSLGQARAQIAEAKRLAKEGDGEEGNYRLDRAKADADLASQVMRAQSEAAKARDAWAKVQAMGGETGAPQ
jgi:hypothetical protein